MQKGRTIAVNFLHLGLIQVSNAIVQILVFPIIIRKTGLEAFGPVIVANSFSALIGLFINFGTSISGVHKVAAAKKDVENLSIVYSQTFAVRIVSLGVFLVFLPLFFLLVPVNHSYLLCALPIAFAELINPLFFYNGQENLLPYTIGNLFSKIVSVLSIIYLVDGPMDAKWVNFYLGLPTVLVFGLLNIFLVQAFRLKWKRVTAKDLLGLFRNNLPLAGNNLAVQLQQSFFLFVLSGTGNSLWLGAYALVDKVLWGFRLLLIAFSNALFPKAVVLAQENPKLAKLRKVQINWYLAVIFMAAAVFLFLFPRLVVKVFAGIHSDLATQMIRAISLVPLLAALNLLNVLELLVLHRYSDIFKIALLLTCLTIGASLLIVKQLGLDYILWYPLLMEFAALMLFLTVLSRRKKRLHIAN